ncbi:MOSC protein, partial [human gut metagenome]
MADGKIIAISISEKKGQKKHNIESANLIVDHGMEGDAHAGNWHRQIS